jgi:hypothetical protein
MIPAFQDDEWRTLPAGIHWASWADIVDQLGFTEHRQEQLSGLYLGLLALKHAGCQNVYIDGSFATGKPFPNDFDLCYDLQGMNRELMDEVFFDFSEQRKRQKTKYGGEFFPANVAATPSGIRYLEFFQINKHTQTAKGIIGIRLGTDLEVKP